VVVRFGHPVLRLVVGMRVGVLRDVVFELLGLKLTAAARAQYGGFA
jgi:hypothetical protein